jgi:hypothetical protein
MKYSFDSRIFTKTKPQKQNHAPKPTRKWREIAWLKLWCVTHISRQIALNPFISLLLTILLVSMCYLFHVTTQRERILFKGDQGEGRRQIKILWRNGDPRGLECFCTMRYVCDSEASLLCVHTSRIVNLHKSPKGYNCHRLSSLKSSKLPEIIQRLKLSPIIFFKILQTHWNNTKAKTVTDYLF